MLRRLALVGFMAGFAVGLSRCGTAPLPGPTSLLIRVSAQAGFSSTVYAYVFSGARGGFEAFAATQRPDPIPDTALGGPQTFRVLFPDAYDGAVIDLTVLALGRNGEVIGFGEASATLKLATDVAVDVGVQPPRGGDGGTGFDAGFDGGASRACACDGGCCLEDGGCLGSFPFALGPYRFALAYCGPADMTCNFICDPMRANRCAGGACHCGAGNPCALGELCTLDDAGVSRCVCDANSGCSGCCDKGTSCRTGQTKADCGRAGHACGDCGDGGVGGTSAGTCRTGLQADSARGVCALVPGCVDTTTCASGANCLKADFPRCRASAAPNGCIGCDPFRANRCDATFASGCACGSVEQCNALQFCDRPTDGGPVRCRSLAAGG